MKTDYPMPTHPAALRALIHNQQAKLDHHELTAQLLECDQIPRDFHGQCVRARQRLAALQQELAAIHGGRRTQEPADECVGQATL